MKRIYIFKSKRIYFVKFIANVNITIMAQNQIQYTITLNEKCSKVRQSYKTITARNPIKLERLYGSDEYHNTHESSILDVSTDEIPMDLSALPPIAHNTASSTQTQLQYGIKQNEKCSKVMRDYDTITARNPIKLDRQCSLYRSDEHYNTHESSVLSASTHEMPIDLSALPQIARNTPPSTPLDLSIFPTTGFTTSTPAPLNFSSLRTSGNNSPPLTPLDLKAVHSHIGNIIDASKMFSSHIPMVADTPANSDDDQTMCSFNVYSVISEPIYKNNRLQELMQNEIKLHREFIEKRIEQFPIKQTYNQKKVRSVCRQNEIKELWSLNDSCQKNKKAEMRYVNNQKSMQSRNKQKMSRINDGLSVLFLRERIAEYEMRIQKMMKLFLHPQEP